MEVKPKEFVLSNEDMSELGFIAQQKVAAEGVSQYWQSRVLQKQLAVEQKLAIDRTKTEVDWRQVFSTGKIVCLPKPIIKTEPKPEEKKK